MPTVPATKIGTAITTPQYRLPVVASASVSTTAPTNSSPYGFSQAQAQAIITNLNACIADVTDCKLVLATLLNELNARGEI